MASYIPSIVQKTFPVLLTLLFVTTTQADVLGSIQGYKFHDANNNAIDDSEPRLTGFTMIVKNVEGTPLQMGDLTNGSGSFEFTNLPLQKYIVCEVLPANSKWITTTQQCIEITLSEESPSVSLIFGNRPKVDTDKGCVRNKSFWNTSAQGNLLLKFLIPSPETLSVGLNKYKLQEVNRILSQPIDNNALLTLAHQLITTKVNVLAGASSTTIAATIANSDAAIGPLAIPPNSGNYIDPTTKPGLTFLSLAKELEKFNEALGQVPVCK